ncbi:MAG: hypothetical protein KDD66_00725 [Bdellovibrionales bacterium]|nr:hypothetical protein [Bdellovibrionales bacterium]
MNPANFYATANFTCEACNPPHVDRQDGGHIVIHPKRPVEHRWELDTAEAHELVELSMRLGKAMLSGLNQRGIPVERINFQDNGNWAIGEGRKPTMHLHLYGRSRNSVHQTHGEALLFPKRETKFWKTLEPLNEVDLAAILAQLNL